MKLWNLPKERRKDIRVVDCETVLHFIPEHGIHVPSQVRCVCEAACVERPGCLLKGGSTWRAGRGRRRWFGDSRECRFCNNIIDLIPDNVVGLIVEDCSEDRYGTSYIEIPSVDG
jgi:hypothetical protein